jgi:hypothetical protein
MAVDNDLLAGFDEQVGNTDLTEAGASLLNEFDTGAPAATPPVEQGGIAPKVVVDPDSASSIVGRSVDQMQAALGSATEVAGELTGSEFLKDAGASFREEQLQEASQYGTPSISSYTQVDFQDPEQIGTYLKQMGLSAVPSLGTGVAGGVAGAKAGSAVGGARGAVVGGILGAITSSLPLNIGEVQNAIKRPIPVVCCPGGHRHVCPGHFWPNLYC